MAMQTAAQRLGRGTVNTQNENEMSEKELKKPEIGMLNALNIYYGGK